MGEHHEYADGLTDGPVRGRGAGLNPGNRFEPIRLHVLGEHLDDQISQEGRTEGQNATQVYRDDTKTIINPVDSPDVGFKWSINPYRGCEHGCVYCYARPFHELLGFSCGLDFETRIMAKVDAADKLRRELAHRRWKSEPIAMSGVTDCYQPIEAQLRITRACLEVLAECRQPVIIVTKNKLVLRDLDLLQTLAQHNAVRVAVSLTSLDAHLSANMEPRASCPEDRLETIVRLAGARVPVMVMVAPVIPGLNDIEIPKLLAAAAQAGAISASYVLLRLPHQVKDLFLEWLQRCYPEKAKRVEAQLRETRHGQLNDSRFGSRMRGDGSKADSIRRLFGIFCAKYGLDGKMRGLSTVGFRRPILDGQMALFDD